MKKAFKYIYLILFSGLILSACVDDEAVRFDVDELQEAVNLRISRSVTSFDATSPDAAVTLTMYSENNDLSKVEMFVDHFIFTQNETTDMVKFKEVAGNTITNDGSTQLQIPLSELTTALGITQDDLSGGDILTIYSIVTLEDGRVYPDTILVGTQFETLNVDAGIIANSGTHSFSPKLQFPIVCPIDASAFTGTYKVEQISGPADPFFGRPTRWTTETVTVTAAGPTRRQFKGTYFTFPDRTFTFDLACNVVLVPPTGGGVGCSGTLTWEQNVENIGTFDINDDSEFTIGILDNITGDCGLTANDPIVLKLTKQ